MGRQLYRSGKKFMTGTMSLLTENSETPFSAIVSQVALDETEHEAVEKTLKVMAMQGHVIQTGEGANATYRLTESGTVLRDALGGA